MILTLMVKEDAAIYLIIFSVYALLIKDRNIDDAHIIYINFEDYDYIDYTDPKKFNVYVKSKIKDDKNLCVPYLINEVPSSKKEDFGSSIISSCFQNHLSELF